MKKLLTCLTLAVVSVAAQAEAPRLRAHGSVAYSHGGEPLISGTYTNGASFELLSGNGWTWSLGAEFRITDSVSIQGSIGHQRNRVNAANADFDFQRQPVELLGFVSLTEQVRLGLGVRKVQGAKVTGADVGYGWTGTGDYDSSTGSIVEMQYLFTTQPSSERKLVTGISLRFVKETFTQTTESGGTGVGKRGDHVGIGLVFYY